MGALPRWSRGLIILGVGAILTLIGVLLMGPIDRLFIKLGFATRRSEVLIPFVATSFVLAAGIDYLKLVIDKRRQPQAGVQSTQVWTLALVALSILILLTSIQLLILIAVFFMAG